MKPFALHLTTLFAALLSLPLETHLAAQESVPLGGELQISSSSVVQARRNPDVAADAAGNFVVVWSSNASVGDDDSEWAVQGRRFACDGVPIGDDFQVNALTAGSQILPQVVMGDVGDFSVSWTTSGVGLFGRNFASDGTPVDSDFVLAGVGSSWRMERDSAGNFIYAWDGADGDALGIEARRFASDGTPLGDAFLVNSYTTGEQRQPRISTHGSGFNIVWINNPVSGDVRAQRYDSGGLPLGSEITASDAPGPIFTFINDVATTDSGEFVVSWNDPLTAGYPIRARRFASDGVPVDASFVVSSGLQPAITIFDSAIDDAGNLQAVWDDNRDPAAEKVRGAFTAAGSTSSGTFVVAETGAPYNEIVRSPVNASDPQGGFVVVWDFTISGTEGQGHILGKLYKSSSHFGDRIWFDADFDGVQDPGEPGLPGVVVRLVDVSTGLPATNPFVTKDDGRYHFNYMLPGDYYLEFTPPEGYDFTLQDQGGDDALDSDVDPATGRTANFPLAVLDTTRDAGFVTVNPVTQVGNRVWLDDGDGLQAGGEPGMAGVTVNLYDGDDNFIADTQTNASGIYLFEATAGDYYVEVVLPPDMAFAPRDQGADDAIDSDFFVASGTTAVFNLALGTTDLSRDAGLEPATIGNRVWADANGDGRQQPGEFGVQGVLVRLLDDADMEVASTTTDADGVYGFLGIATGDYRIEVIAPSGTGFTTQNAGADDLIDSDVDPSTGRTALFSYTAGGASRSHDAGIAVLFADGFESGDVSAWSSNVP